MRKLALVAGCLLFAAPALAQSLGEKTGLNSWLGVSPSTVDFVKEATISDLFEVQSSQLALQRSDEPTKAFATRMVADHEKMSQELDSMVHDGSIPTDMDSSHRSMWDKLTGLNGSDFTKQYHGDQVSALDDAVSLFLRYSKHGETGELKIWAGKNLPTLEDHLKMAQDLDK